jgi:hypothetical protein
VSAASSSTRRLLPEGLEPESVLVGPSDLTVRAGVPVACARCPICKRRSERVHSRYERTVSDLPWRGVSVRLKIRARRFFCENRGCKRSIFCERLPEITAHARKTERLEEASAMIAFELGGEAGARLARELGLPISPDALLERIRRAPRLGAGQVKVLGVDDWAIKKGHSYGTILVDLERRRVVGLLPDRSAEGLRDWLEKHPGMEAASRDRFQPYIDAISTAAPGAVQVADRWHLLKNLSDAVERVLERERISLNEALKLTLPEPPPVGPDALAGELGERRVDSLHEPADLVVGGLRPTLASGHLRRLAVHGRDRTPRAPERQREDHLPRPAGQAVLALVGALLACQAGEPFRSVPGDPAPEGPERHAGLPRHGREWHPFAEERLKGSETVQGLRPPHLVDDAGTFRAFTQLRSPSVPRPSPATRWRFPQPTTDTKARTLPQ